MKQISTSGITCFSVVVWLSSLIQDLKEREPEFPDVSSGVYIYEVIPGTAASR